MTLVPQLTREQYLDRVRNGLPAVATERADEAVEAIRWRIGTAKDAARLSETLECFLVDPSAGHAGVLEIYDVADVRAALERPGFAAHNWHYDRTARALLVNLRRGRHESLAGTMFAVYRGFYSLAITKQEEESAAEQFVLQGLGWFKSSVSSRPLKGPAVALDGQERMAFRGIEFRLL